MTFPTKMPEFLPFKFEDTILCTYEDAVKDHEERREFHEQKEKCFKARSSKLYSKIMRLCGEYERKKQL